jgi:beta-lactamase regulating signal transducer with metallopeptidase domain
MSAVLDHLWQSTLFAAAIAFMTLAFRKHRAAVRHALWFAASAKFLLPFSALVALGETLGQPYVPTPSKSLAFEPLMSAAAPFSEMPSAAVTAEVHRLHLTTLLLAAWIIGFAVLSAMWLIRWVRLNSLVRAARDLPGAAGLPVKVAPARIEPGLVGIWRPVLLLPQGLLERLSREEMAAIEAHELCHRRRGDNLTAAIHTLVTNVFWFHPLLWWLGGRLIEERERACDESVLHAGHDPAIYAGSILKVCTHYVPFPLACAAGGSGASLKLRVEMIVTNRRAVCLTTTWKAVLTAAIAALIAVPIAIGLTTLDAAASGDATPSTRLTAQRIADQRRPRTEIALMPARFDRFAGYYRVNSNVIYVVSRRGDHFFAGPLGHPPARIYPDSPNDFFLRGLSIPAQFTFTTDAKGHVTEMVLHQAGADTPAARILAAEGKAAEAALARRIANDRPSPGTQEAIRSQIQGLMDDKPDYATMAPSLAAGTRLMLGPLHAKVAAWGPVLSIEFMRVGKDGLDVYDVTCRNRRSIWRIGPLTPDGKISAIFFNEEG